MQILWIKDKSNNISYQGIRHWFNGQGSRSGHRITKIVIYPENMANTVGIASKIKLHGLIFQRCMHSFKKWFQLNFIFCVPGVCPEPVSSGQNVPGSQDTVLWHWSLSVLCHDWIWFNWISHCRILLKGKTVSRYKKDPTPPTTDLPNPKVKKCETLNLELGKVVINITSITSSFVIFL